MENLVGKWGGTNMYNLANWHKSQTCASIVSSLQTATINL